MVPFHQVMVHLERVVVLIGLLKFSCHSGKHDTRHVCGILLMLPILNNLFRSSSDFINLLELFVEDMFLVLTTSDHPNVSNPITEVPTIKDDPPTQVHEGERARRI